jgi:hypothetical protein
MLDDQTSGCRRARCDGKSSPLMRKRRPSCGAEKWSNRSGDELTKDRDERRSSHPYAL